MPHFKTKTLKLPALPCTISHLEGEFSFLELYTSYSNPNFSLLEVLFTPKSNPLNKIPFFLEIKKQNDQTLVRFDKNSRISPIEIIKNALEILTKEQEDLITHNLYGKNNIHELKMPFIKHISDFSDFKQLLFLTPLKNPKIWLEIGFGSGRNLLNNAKENPNILHIGLEIHRPSLEQVARQIGLLKLKNILILAYDARIFLELLPSNILEKIFVHFPIPWDKKPHRRVFSKAFLEQSQRVLEVNGILELRTDSFEYFLYAKNLEENLKNIKILHKKNEKKDIISKYEARWLRQDKDIYNLEMKNLDQSKEKTFNLDFSFKNTKTNTFHKQKIIKSDFFINLEDFLQGKDSNLYKVAFGDFNYPETRYIKQNQTLEYFRENPLPTTINHQCHNLLCALL